MPKKCIIQFLSTFQCTKGVIEIFDDYSTIASKFNNKKFHGKDVLWT